MAFSTAHWQSVRTPYRFQEFQGSRRDSTARKRIALPNIDVDDWTLRAQSNIPPSGRRSVLTRGAEAVLTPSISPSQASVASALSARGRGEVRGAADWDGPASAHLSHASTEADDALRVQSKSRPSKLSPRPLSECLGRAVAANTVVAALRSSSREARQLLEPLHSAAEKGANKSHSRETSEWRPSPPQSRNGVNIPIASSERRRSPPDERKYSSRDPSSEPRRSPLAAIRRSSAWDPASEPRKTQDEKRGIWRDLAASNNPIVSQNVAPEPLPVWPEPALAEAWSLESQEQVIEAFKQVLIGMHGSIDYAFRWFDLGSRGLISRSQFSAGLEIMKVEEPLKSAIKNARLFAQIDSTHSGAIDREDWQEFFSDRGDCRVGKGVSSKVAKTLERVRLMKTFFANASRRRSIKDDMDFAAGSHKRSSLQLILELAEEEEEDAKTLESGGARRLKARSDLMETDMDRAVAQQVKDDIKRLDLRGIKALAHVFISKFGSLDGAFAWLDPTCKGYFPRVNWETGLLVMHVDIEELTGLSTQDIYAQMMALSGMITKESWDAFFYGELDESDIAELAAAHAKFLQSAKRRIGEKFTAEARAVRGRSSRKRASGVARMSSPGAAARDLHTPSKQEQGDASENFSLASTPEPGTQRASTDLNGSESRRPGSKVRRRRSSKARRRLSSNARNEAAFAEPKTHVDVESTHRGDGDDAAIEANIALKSSRRPSVEVPVDVEQVPAGLADDASKTKSSRRPSAQNMSQQARQRILDEIRGLGKDQSLDYKSLTSADRVLVEGLAKDLGFVCVSNGESLVVLREGEECGRIRKALGAVPLGQSLRLTDLSKNHQLLAQLLAECLGLRSIGQTSGTNDETEPSTFEVSSGSKSLQDFRSRVHAELNALRPGQVKDYPATLSTEEVAVVRDIAKTVGLVSHSLDTESSAGSAISVGHLNDFAGEVRAEVAALREGQAQSYGPDRVHHPLMEHMVRLVAGELGLGVSSTQNDRDEVSLIVERGAVRSSCSSPTATGSPIATSSRSRPASGRKVVGGAKRPSSVNPTDDEETIIELRERVFYTVATGVQGRNKFLRKIDLNNFLRSTCTKQKHDLDIVLDAVAHIYDDTLELQCDMGARIYHGITLDYFQVFLTKVSKALGMSLMALLMALLDWFDS